MSSWISWFITLLIFWYIISVILRKLLNGKIIGITGGIAAGKSSFVNRMMNQAPIPVIDFDVISRDVSTPGAEGWVKLRKQFPLHYFNEETGELQREELAKLVFSDATERRRLNEALRVPMRNLFLWLLYGAFALRRQGMVFVVAPLLFEMKLHWICHRSVCVVIDREEEQKRRLAERDCLNEDEVRGRISAQMPTERKRRMADIVILNNGTLDDLNVQADRFLESMGDLFVVEYDENHEEAHEGHHLSGEKHTHVDWAAKKETWVQCLIPNLVSSFGAFAITGAIFSVYFGLYLWSNLCSIILQ